MKTTLKFAAIGICLGLPWHIYGQNVGIGTTSTDKARFTVVGTADAGSKTVALFGTTAGISLQQDWPTIGFNQYRAVSTGRGHAISTGFGAHLAFNFTNGDLALYRNGYSTAGTQFNQQDVVLGYLEASSRLLLNSSLPSGKVELANRVYTPRTGAFNLVPLGIINMSMRYFPEQDVQGAASNLAGTLVQGYFGLQEGVNKYFRIYLDPAMLAGYDMNKVILIPGLNFTHANTSDLFSLQTRFVNGSPPMIQVQAFTGSVNGSFEISGNIIVYGHTN